MIILGVILIVVGLLVMSYETPVTEPIGLVVSLLGMVLFLGGLLAG